MTRTCSRCGTPDLAEACPVCTAEWENRRDAAAMSPEERAAEFDSWGPVLEIDFEKLHQRIEELVGRPVWTHELARTDLLRHEILTGIRPSMEGILAKIPPHVDVIPIVIDDPDEEAES
jgi:hypothetical protein